METSDAIRIANDDNYSRRSSNNWYIFLFAVIITLFAVYWGFVRPTSRQLTKMRRYVTSLETSLAELNGQSANNEATMTLLNQLVAQGNKTTEATAALQEVRSLHQQIIHEASQLRSAQQALENLAALRTDVARQSSLVDATKRALSTLEELHNDVCQSAGETEEARLAVEKLNVVRDGLVESIEQIGTVNPLIVGIDGLQTRLAATTDRATSAQTALDQLITLGDKIEAQAASVKQADTTLDHMVTLQEKVISQTEPTAAAIETLELATDVQFEMRRAGETFNDMKRMLTDMTLMQPKLQQAMESLQPLVQLTDLRRLGAVDLREVASVVRERYLTTTTTSEATEIVADAAEISNVE